MTNIIDKHAALHDAEWAKLSINITEYNEYMTLQLSKILDFDIWFEHSTNLEFPKEWYSMIRESAAHK